MLHLASACRSMTVTLATTAREMLRSALHDVLINPYCAFPIASSSFFIVTINLRTFSRL